MTTDAIVPLRAGASFGVGSLPHRSVSKALDFVWSSTDIPTIPSLPRRSPAEGMVAQALVGIEGVSVGQYGGISVDVSALDVDHFITTDLSSEAYGAFAAFLETFPMRNKGAKAVKWQFVGPVTLGMALVRIGVEASIAFPLALQAVREHVSALQEEVRRATGGLTQIIVLDEPLLDEALELGFHIGSEEVIDLISGALAAVSRDNINGLHCCAHTNWRAMLSTGASVLSVPVPSVANNEDSSELLAAASRISDHMAHGGRIAWGAVRTDGPISVNSERSWKALMDVMCSLVNAGVDPVLLRRMSYVTPACGLATHSDAVAEQVFAQVRNIATKVGEQATASRLTLGS
jgi:methionine synthase II (cobalamin-independent)